MTSKKITLDGSHRQLIDFGVGDIENFNSTIVITPSAEDSEKAYEIAFTNQTNLDAGVDLKFASIKGSFRKNFRNEGIDTLIINSSDTFNDMQIDITVEEIVKQNQPQQPKIMPKSRPVEQQVVEHFNDDSGKNIKYVVGILVVLVGGFLLYYFWKQSQIDKTVSENVETVVAPSVPVIEEVSLPKTLTDISKPSFSFY